MSLFLANASFDPPEIVDLDDEKDENIVNDLPFVAPTKKSRKRATNSLRPTNLAHKRRKHETTSSTIEDPIDLDDDLYAQDTSYTFVPSPGHGKDPTSAPSAPKDLADQILGEEELALTRPFRPKSIHSSTPRYYISDPDVSVSTPSIIATAETQEALEVSLQVSPELLNTAKNQERRVEDRDSSKLFVFKLYYNQKLELIVKKFLEIDQSTWCLGDLQLKLHGLDVPLDNTPRDEGMVGGEELHLSLKAQPEGDPLSPLDFAPLNEKLEFEEDEEEKISVIVQSRTWGKQTYRMAMNKPFGQLYNSVAKQNKLSPQEKQGLCLRFDGETIGRKQTPEDLDMGNEDTVDVVIKKKK